MYTQIHDDNYVSEPFLCFQRFFRKTLLVSGTGLACIQRLASAGNPYLKTHGKEINQHSMIRMGKLSTDSQSLTLQFTK